MWICVEHICQFINDSQYGWFNKIVPIYSKITSIYWHLSTAIRSKATYNNHLEKCAFFHFICPNDIHIDRIFMVWCRISVRIWIYMFHINLPSQRHRQLYNIHLESGKYVQIHWKLWAIHYKAWVWRARPSAFNVVTILFLLLFVDRREINYCI